LLQLQAVALVLWLQWQQCLLLRQSSLTAMGLKLDVV
jgi:hypothetical protein